MLKEIVFETATRSLWRNSETCLDQNLQIMPHIHYSIIRNCKRDLIYLLGPLMLALRLRSTSELLAESMLARIDELLLPRRCRLASSGLCGFSPLTFAKRFNTSVSEITPHILPDMCCPGILAAGTALPAKAICRGAATEGADILEKVGKGAGTAVGWTCGVAEEGDGASTIHMRCDRVATSLATVCARVEYGLT